MSQKGQSISRTIPLVKIINVEILHSHGVDNVRFAHEEHQLSISDDEQFYGICFVYGKDKEIIKDIPSKPSITAERIGM